MNRRILLTLVAVALVVGVGIEKTGGGGGYHVKLVMPSAAMLSHRTPVWINGQRAGEIDKLEVKNGKAVATLSLDDHWGPLHTGTSSRVDWVSAVGERVLTLYPGKKSNPEIPDGGMFDGPSRQVEVDQVLATLDAPTRAKLASLIGQLDQTTQGHETELNDAITSASGTVSGLGSVLIAVGDDGPAIRTLVTQLRQMTDQASARRAKLSATVQDLTSISSAVAGQQAQISATLRELPSALAAARTTLGKVPAASDATVGLLHDLRPATDKLPGVSADLAPTLVDLRPTVAQLRPLLSAASELLGKTPRRTLSFQT
jgi:phospholipid/cholesterol/gamma-HCH transport system substrate-binding protein